MISIVVRARNEAAWLPRCLTALKAQCLNDLDVILVDNASSDDTVEIAERFGARITHISDDEFSFGRALNRGIALAKHDVVALLSAHCIPINELWADYFLAHLGPEATRENCGVYGRQEPLPETSDIDRRDLWTTFRHERIIQRTDYFFHNANSAVRKTYWCDTPFDEEINGVEDCDWGRKMIAAGCAIVYEPAAAVYHHHGIHHGRNEARAARVANAVADIKRAHACDRRKARPPRRLNPDLVREELIALGLPIAALREPPAASATEPGALPALRSPEAEPARQSWHAEPANWSLELADEGEFRPPQSAAKTG